MPALGQIFCERGQLFGQEILARSQRDDDRRVIGNSACEERHVIDLIVVLFELPAPLRVAQGAIGIEQIALAVPDGEVEVLVGGMRDLQQRGNQKFRARVIEIAAASFGFDDHLAIGRDSILTREAGRLVHVDHLIGDQRRVGRDLKEQVR